MEPLSAAASVIAVLQLSEAVLSACCRYLNKAKDASSDILRVIHRVGYLSALLRDLQQHATADPASSTLAGLIGEQGPLAVCQRSLEKLKARFPPAMIGSGSGSGPGPVSLSLSLRQKLTWPFEAKKVDDVLERIATQLPVIELALVGDTLGVANAIRESLEDAKRREERDKALNWLSCADPSVKHVASRELHQPAFVPRPSS
jgi:hypothetical protein